MTAGPQAEIEAVRQLALKYLGAHDRTERELRERLERRQCPAAAVDAVLARLKAVGLVDDEAVARRWVEARLAERPTGSARLVQDLRRRGVDGAVVQRVLGELADRIGTEAGALALLRRVAGRYRGLEAAAAQRRMHGLLARRGFDPDTAARAVETAWREMEGS